MILDSAPCDPCAESELDRSFRLYKTTERSIYDEASERGGEYLALPPLDYFPHNELTD